MGLKPAPLLDVEEAPLEEKLAGLERLWSRTMTPKEYCTVEIILVGN